MITGRIRFFLIAGPIISLLAGYFFGSQLKSTRHDFDIQAPVRVVRITIDPVNQDQLFAQLSAFANKWHYAILIEEISPTPYDDYRIQLWRFDMMLSGMYPTDPGVFEFGFFETQSSMSVPEKYFDDEIDHLEIFISSIQGAKLEVTK
jgi:hypothetical protein